MIAHALSRTGIDPHRVGEALDGAEAGAGAAGGRVAVLHAAIRIGHAAAAIQCQHFQPGALGIVASAGVDMPAAAVLQKVGGKFGDDDRHLVDPCRRQPDATREIA